MSIAQILLSRNPPMFFPQVVQYIRGILLDCVCGGGGGEL